MSIPKGYKLVPVEPTEYQMKIARSMTMQQEQTVGAEYRAMVKAAPTPPQVLVQCSFCNATNFEGNPWSSMVSLADGKLVYRVVGCKDHKYLVDACQAAIESRAKAGEVVK